MNPPFKIPLIVSIILTVLFFVLLFLGIAAGEGGMVFVIILPLVALVAIPSFTILSRRLFQNENRAIRFFGFISVLILILPIKVFIDGMFVFFDEFTRTLTPFHIPLILSIILAFLLTLPTLKRNNTQTVM